MLVGHDAESILDALVFSGFTLPIDRVMVNGTWKVIDGVHTDAEMARQKYTSTIKSLNWREMAAP